jgi:hypothetical protein
MGGTRRRLIIAWPIFVLVGLWHDLEVLGGWRREIRGGRRGRRRGWR